MPDDNYSSIRNLVWKMNIPETVLAIYFNHVRAFPAWKKNFPQYLHPSILDVVQLAPSQIKVITDRCRYIFIFEERDTLVAEAADFVKTGVLELFCDDVSVLRLSISPSDSDSVETGETRWTARCVEEFREGEWIDELAQLARQLVAFEDEQKRKEQERREREEQSRTELQSRLGAVRTPPPQRDSWLQRLLKH
jgi:hypothetical protein